MGKDIVRIYKHGQFQLSTSSLKVTLSSSPDPQKSPAIKLTSSYVPSVTDKNQKNLFLIPKIPPRMMQPSQTMTTYILVRHQKTNYTI